MNDNLDNQSRVNRFIFSDDYYDKFNDIPLEEPVSFDAPTIQQAIEIPKVEEPKTEEKNIIVEKQEEPDLINFSNINYIEPTETNIEVEPSVEKAVTIDNINNDSINNIELNNILPEYNNDFVKQESNIPVVEQQNEIIQPIINNISEEIPTIQNVQPIINEPELVPEEVIPNEVVNHNIQTYEEPVLPTINIVENNIEDSKPNLLSTSSFNVETGINNTLEQELMKARIENETKNQIVEDYGRWEPKKEEKTPYRATRNQPQEIPIWLREDVVLPVYQPPKVLTDTSVYIQPEVINIDEEILKDEIDEPTPTREFDYEGNSADPVVMKSTLLDELRKKEQETGKISILARYGEDFCSKDYVTNPAIGRQEEIKQTNLILLTPEKSVILVGKPGIGKTSIVEGLAYQLQRNNVPDALKGYRIISIKTTSLLGTLPTGDTRLQTLIDELKDLDKVILFIDEIHMLMGATNESGLDFANMFKESLGRGNIKMIGATTSDEYERYVLRDKAFVRRFQRVDVEEPTKEQTIKILMGTLPKIEKNTGARLKYSEFVQTEIMTFIVDITTEYKRVYGIGSRYPDICLTLLTQAFSQAVFDNRHEVNIMDVRKAIENSKNIYPDVIKKELINFDEKFSKLIHE